MDGFVTRRHWIAATLLLWLDKKVRWAHRLWYWLWLWVVHRHEARAQTMESANEPPAGA
jgi:hypothetical protein